MKRRPAKRYDDVEDSPSFESFLKADADVPEFCVCVDSLVLPEVLPLLKDKTQYMYQRREAAIARALEQKNANAYFTIAYCIYGGGGVPGRVYAPHTWEDQFKYAKMASDDGHVGGMFLVGMCHWSGHGAVKDMQKAHEFINESARKGFSEACVWIGERYLNSQDRFENKQDIARRYWEVAAKHGDREAQCLLADLLMRYRHQERERGFQLFEQAAAAGYHRARFELAQWLIFGHSNIKDPKRAKELLTLVSNRGTDDEGGCHWINMANNALQNWDFK